MILVNLYDVRAEGMYSPKLPQGIGQFLPINGSRTVGVEVSENTDIATSYQTPDTSPL
jgi:hypothetical protein